MPHGRDPATGLDCYGLVWLFYRQELELEIPAYDDLYADEAEVNEALAIARDQQGIWVEVPKEDARLGDVALFRSLREVLHVAVMLDRVRFLHLNESAIYARVEKITSAIWRERLIGVYRHKERMDRE
jgi:cell wall-associated NlpC family hydrolase